MATGSGEADLAAAVALLRDVEEIKKLKARYFRLLDTKQWDQWRTLFADDAYIEFDGVERGGPDEFVKMNAKLLADAATVHQGHDPEIDVIGPDEATAVWALSDHVRAGEVDGKPTGLRGAAHYHDTYRRVDGSWRIARTVFVRLHIEWLEGGPPPGW